MSDALPPIPPCIGQSGSMACGQNGRACTIECVSARQLYTLAASLVTMPNDAERTAALTALGRNKGAAAALRVRAAAHALMARAAQAATPAPGPEPEPVAPPPAAPAPALPVQMDAFA
jgi:hypothetical protein